MIDGLRKSSALSRATALAGPASPVPERSPSPAQVDAFVQPAPKGEGTRPLPSAISTGSLDYYRQRYADFVSRNPGQPPPAYYLNYGDKYVHRFAALGPNDLSPEGLVWRDRVLKGLQDAIEQKRQEDPAAFAQLERNSDAFTRFCYDTHPKVYVENGFLDLPVQDMMTVLGTMDAKDVLNPGGIKQMLEVAEQVRPENVVKILEATALTALQRLPFHLPELHLPSLPVLDWGGS